MSYDIRLGVKVEGGDNLFAVIAEPKLSDPTYNLREMFVNCTGWNYKQGEWYKVSEVIPLIENGIHELRFNSKEYEQYNPKNGWAIYLPHLKHWNQYWSVLEKTRLIQIGRGIRYHSI